MSRNFSYAAFLSIKVKMVDSHEGSPAWQGQTNRI
jgi:hypothetical protein